MASIPAILAVLFALSVVLGAASFANSSGRLAPEFSRKLVHVGMGLICLTFPWVFHSALPVQVLALIAVGSLALLRHPKLKTTVGRGLFSVSRISIGEVLFPIAVAWIFTLSNGQPLLYCVPILQLTLADTAGALVGTRIGKRLFNSSGGTKSLEGSIAFFIVALLCAAVPLAFATHHLPLTALIAIPLLIALFVTAVEGVSGHGLDNLFIPFGSWLLLDYYIDLDPSSLIVRFLVLVFIGALLAVTARRHYFDGGAILASALFGFGAFALGGLWCLIATLLLFLLHLLIQRRVTLADSDPSSVGIIFAISLPTLPWLTLARIGQLPESTACVQFITTIAALSAMIFADARRKNLGSTSAIVGSLMVATIILTCALPLKLSLLQLFAALLPISVATLVYYFYRRESKASESNNNWIILTSLAAASACTTFVFNFFNT